MGIKPKYKSDHKDSIIAAMQVMIENLYMHLQITDRVSIDLDTVGEHRKTFEMCDEPSPSDEELRREVEKSKDGSIRELGHIQKRIDEARFLKEAFESTDEVPSSLILSKTYGALRSSMTFETMNLCWRNPCEEIFAKGIDGLDSGYSKEKRDEIERIRKTIQAYSEALMFGFNVSPFFWNEFPFDTP